MKQGRCVRAVSGHREHYRPVVSFRFPGGGREVIAGDPRRLIDCYRRCGIKRFYVADLDSLMGGRVQRELHRSLLTAVPEDCDVMIDVGLCNDRDCEALEFAQFRKNKVAIVVASESAASVSLVQVVRAAYPRQPLVISLDYRDGRWISGLTQETDWISACRQHQNQIESVIALDLAAVGKRTPEKTLALCRRIGGALPDVRLVTGGGIRTPDDADRLFAAGADRLLVSSLFTDDDDG